MTAAYILKLLLSSFVVGLSTQLTPRSRINGNYGNSNHLSTNYEGGTQGENDYWLFPLLYALLGVFIFSVLLYAVYKICRVCNEVPAAIPYEEERVNMHSPSTAPMLPSQNAYSPLSANPNDQEQAPIWNGMKPNTMA